MTEKETILIVDDGPDHLLALEKVVQKALPDLRIMVCQDPQKAMPLLRENHISVALLDLQAPGIGGLELCAQIKSDTATQNATVMLVTSHASDPTVKARGLELGADDFLTLPLDNAELVARIKVALRIHRDKNTLLQQVSTAQAALSISETTIRAIFEKTRDGILMVDSATRALHIANPAMCRMMGYESQEMMTLTVADLHPESESASVADSVERYISDLESHASEAVMKRRDGSLFYADIHTSQVKLGKNKYLLATVCDVTDRRNTERQLKLFRDLIDHSTDAIYVIDPATACFSDVSEGAAAALEYTREELLNMGVLDIQSVIPDADAWTKQVEILKVANSLTRETEHIRKNGTILPVEVNAKYLKSEDGDHVVAIARDITERRVAENQARQQERLNALAQLVGGIAHDFNNVLTPIIGFSDMLLSDPELLDDRKELVQSLEIIQSASYDARHIVRRMGQVYKEEVGEYTSVDLAKVMESVISLTMPKWKQEMNAKGAPIEMVTTFKRVPLINGHVGELREVFTNLIFNALDAMPEGGTITLSLETKHENVFAEVSDTGSGMDEERSRRCMEPFFTTKGVRGTGLGLSMVDGIVKRHGGSTRINSRPGVGTTVAMQFPVPAVRNPIEKTATAKPLSPLRILIIDDEERSRHLLVKILASDAHVTSTAKDGPEGVNIAREQDFDLIFTDRAMPLMSGDDVAAELAKFCPETPIIMLTGFGDIMRDHSELPKGVSRVIAKPVTRNELRLVMAQVMRQTGKA